MMQHVAPTIAGAGQRLLRLSGGRADRVPARRGSGRAKAKPRPAPPSLRPMPAELGGVAARDRRSGASRVPRIACARPFVRRWSAGGDDDPGRRPNWREEDMRARIDRWARRRSLWPSPAAAAAATSNAAGGRAPSAPLPQIAAPNGGDWTQTVTATADGGFLHGQSRRAGEAGRIWPPIPARLRRILAKRRQRRFATPMSVPAR